MASEISEAEADQAEQKKSAAENQQCTAPERQFGVAFALYGFELILAKVSNHSLPLGS
jgi:hypothetical protein